MNKLIIILIVLFCNLSYAGFYVKGVEGEDSVYYSDKDIKAYNSAKELLASNPKNYLKYENGILARKEQSDIDAIIQAKKDAVILAEQTRIDNLELTVKELIQVLEKLGILGDKKEADIITELKTVSTESEATRE